MPSETEETKLRKQYRGRGAGAATGPFGSRRGLVWLHIYYVSCTGGLRREERAHAVRPSGVSWTSMGSGRHFSARETLWKRFLNRFRDSILLKPQP